MVTNFRQNPPSPWPPGPSAVGLLPTRTGRFVSAQLRRSLIRPRPAQTQISAHLALYTPRAVERQRGTTFCRSVHGWGARRRIWGLSPPSRPICSACSDAGRAHCTTTRFVIGPDEPKSETTRTLLAATGRRGASHPPPTGYTEWQPFSRTLAAGGLAAIRAGPRVIRGAVGR